MIKGQLDFWFLSSASKAGKAVPSFKRLPLKAGDRPPCLAAARPSISCVFGDIFRMGFSELAGLFAHHSQIALLIDLSTQGAGMLYVLAVLCLISFSGLFRVGVVSGAFPFVLKIGICFAPAVVILTKFIAVLWAPFPKVFSLASLTNALNTVRALLVGNHQVGGFPDSAFAANLTDGHGEEKHRVSLSLNRMLASASGAIDRLSVISLADKLDYTTGVY